VVQHLTPPEGLSVFPPRARGACAFDLSVVADGKDGGEWALAWVPRDRPAEICPAVRRVVAKFGGLVLVFRCPGLQSTTVRF